MKQTQRDNILVNKGRVRRHSKSLKVLQRKCVEMFQIKEGKTDVTAKCNAWPLDRKLYLGLEGEML